MVNGPRNALGHWGAGCQATSQVVRRTYQLLPAPRIGWEVEESDEIPEEFLIASPAAVDTATLASLLSRNRQAVRTQWKMALPNLLGTQASWEVWVKESMKEVRANSPVAAQGAAMNWFASAFKLQLTPAELWFVSPEMEAFDNSLSSHLQSLLAAAPGTNGREFVRRMLSLENAALAAGRTIPARKLVSMLAHHSVKDPTYADALHEAAFAALEVTGASVQDATSLTRS